MARERRYRWVWAAVLALSFGARAAEPAPSGGEAEKAEIARLVARLDSSCRSELSKEAEALLDKGAAAVPALEELQKSAKSDGLRNHAEQLLALIRGGEVVGGWQASLRAAHAAVHKGEIVPLVFTITNRSGAERAYAMPSRAVSIQPGQRAAEEALVVYVRRLTPQREAMERAMDQRSEQSGESLTVRIKPGEGAISLLALKPKDEDWAEMLKAEGEYEAPLTTNACLPPGRYTVQALRRAAKDGPLVASGRVEIAVRPWDWKALDETERRALHKHVAAAEAALDKDEALRAKLRAAGAKLDDEDWQVREGASKALAEAGLAALPEIFRLQAESGSLEARTRAGELLDALRAAVVEGGETQAGLRATLRLDRHSLRHGETAALAFELRNVSQEGRDFLPVHELDLDGASNDTDDDSARAAIELQREDGEHVDRHIMIDRFRRMMPQEAPVNLAAGASRVRKIEMTVTGQEALQEALEVEGKEERPFKCNAVLPSGRYRVRIVYRSYSCGLVKGALDDLGSNWVALDVRE